MFVMRESERKGSSMYPAPKQFDTRVRELVEEIAEVMLDLDALEHDDGDDAEPRLPACA